MKPPRTWAFLQQKKNIFEGQVARPAKEARPMGQEALWSMHAVILYRVELVLKNPAEVPPRLG